MTLATLCLGMLSLGPATAYGLRQRIARMLGPQQQVSFGALYPALDRLAASGAIVADPAGAGGDRAGRTLHLTAAGERRLVRELEAARATERVRSEFLAALLFADRLSAADRARLADRRVADLRDDQRRIQSELRAPQSEGHRLTLRYALAVNRAALAFLEGEGRAILRGMPEPAAELPPEG